MTLVAPRIVNDLPYVSTVNHDIHFEWQAPYLLRCVGDACSMYFTGNILRSAGGVVNGYNHLRTLACLAQGVS